MKRKVGLVSGKLLDGAITGSSLLCADSTADPGNTANPNGASKTGDATNASSASKTSGANNAGGTSQRGAKAWREAYLSEGLPCLPV